ncbi:complement component C1q receptor [Engraulis encrasicolus]|uniref:complement component C1q receptor n=1 Tax=Engraulis encrasicolus TaxID=184585 RepID=UPI002FD59973
MFSLFLLCYAFLAGEVASSQSATLCLPKACFTLYREALPFQEAAKKCEDHGGHVMTTRDKTESDYMEYVLSQFGESTSQLWIGLMLPKGHCTSPNLNLKGFKWIHGEEDTQYSNWRKEPETTCTEERCVVAQASSSVGLKWMDISCKGQHIYLCRNHFKGMCPSLPVLGSWHVEYNVPMSDSPFNHNAFSVWPHGTFATIVCGSTFLYTLCNDINGVYTWSNPGPFCNEQKPRCDHLNGGCTQLCVADESGARCACREGYQLGDDGISCVLKNNCDNAPCAYKCLSKTSGFLCTCPDGFQLAADQINCEDLDECSLTHSCGDDVCINTNGSYTCQCKEGFSLLDGKCHDIDECVQSRCPQGCLNSLGSFSCYCYKGYRSSDRGLSCVDIDECLTNRCEDECTNTLGSFVCSCRPNMKLASNGISCLPDKSEGSHSSHGIDVTLIPSQIPQRSTSPVVNHSPTSSLDSALIHPITHAPFGGTGEPVSDAQLGNSFVLYCILASVIPLIILIFLTAAIVIYRCNRSRSHKKKQSPTADSYCWVSSEPCQIKYFSTLND